VAKLVKLTQTFPTLSTMFGGNIIHFVFCAVTANRW